MMVLVHLLMVNGGHGLVSIHVQSVVVEVTSPGAELVTTLHQNMEGLIVLGPQQNLSLVMMTNVLVST